MKRAVAAVGLALLTPALAGCDVSGTLTVTDQDVAFDISAVVEQRGSAACPAIEADHTVSVSPRDDGRVTCRYVGTAALANGVLENAYGAVVVTDTLATLRGHDLAALPPQSAGLDSFDLTVHLLGTIEATNGTITGSDVRWTDVATLTDQGIVAVARRGPADLGPLLWGLGAAAAGFAATLAVSAWRRRGAPPVGPVETGLDQLDQRGFNTPDQEDPEVWAPEDDRA